jgi:uncharacterized protein (DUF427 family)
MPGQEPGEVRAERSAKRVRAYLRGELVADSKGPLLVWEFPYYPVYYLPAEDVRAKLIPAGRAEPSRALGTAELLHVQAGATLAELAGRRYPDSPVPELRDAVRLDFGAMSEWLEEEEPIYGHPRDPYKRVDILASSRHVQVVLDGVVVAQSGQPRILFETGLPPRYYLPLTDIRQELLRPSATSTLCPYKGNASYWSVDTGTAVHEDLVWTYRSPFAESQKIAGLACFYNERVDLFVDGEPVPRPRTPFS